MFAHGKTRDVMVGRQLLYDIHGHQWTGWIVIEDVC
jgi:hypothetical protein